MTTQPPTAQTLLGRRGGGFTVESGMIRTGASSSDAADLNDKMRRV